MTKTQGDRPRRRWLVWTAAAVAGLIGLKYGYDFGDRLSGPVLGAIAGVNLAVLCGFVGGSAVRWIVESRASRRDGT